MPSVVSTGFLVALFAAAVAAAAPAAAIDDPSRPDAQVTHGPSCRPGGLVVEVQAGTVPYVVRLATTREPAGEDEAELAPGESAVLRTANVAWGETIDGRLEYTSRDGSAATYVDELEHYSFTRPTQEDCDAITAAAAPEPPGPGPGASAPAPTPTAGTDGDDAAPASSAPGSGGPTTTPSTGDGQPGPSAPSTDGETSGASGERVAAGSTVTLQAAGFLPGERVTILLHAGGAVLGSAVAGDDGTVWAEVQIPSGTAIGAARLDLVGDSSAVVSNLQLQVAAEQVLAAVRGTVPLWLLVAAAVALVGSIAGLVSVAGRQHAMRHAMFSSGSA
ncbi:MAG: hypothetical protein JWQ45_1385 [Blastococcus sp.]|nr:hypothetical protein [Blastococcus sp.]